MWFEKLSRWFWCTKYENHWSIQNIYEVHQNVSVRTLLGSLELCKSASLSLDFIRGFCSYSSFTSALTSIRFTWREKKKDKFKWLKQDRSSNVRKLGVGHLKLAALATLVCHLLVQDVCSGSNHHICTRVGRKREGHGHSFTDTSKKLHTTLLPYISLAKLSHLAILICKGGWEM